MSDSAAFAIFAFIACAIFGTCGWAAGSVDELERGVDVPEQMEGL